MSLVQEGRTVWGAIEDSSLAAIAFERYGLDLPHGRDRYPLYHGRDALTTTFQFLERAREAENIGDMELAGLHLRDAARTEANVCLTGLLAKVSNNNESTIYLPNTNMLSSMIIDRFRIELARRMGLSVPMINWGYPIEEYLERGDEDRRVLGEIALSTANVTISDQYAFDSEPGKIVIQGISYFAENNIELNSQV